MTPCSLHLTIVDHGQAPQSAHHPHKNHVEHCLCNAGGGVHFALLLGSDNSYTTPSKYPLLDWKSCVAVVVYGWWSPSQGGKNNININFSVRISCGHSWPLHPDAPGSKSFSPSPGPQKNALFGADVRNFRRGRPWCKGFSKNFVQTKFALIFWPLPRYCAMWGVSRIGPLSSKTGEDFIYEALNWNQPSEAAKTAALAAFVATPLLHVFHWLLRPSSREQLRYHLSQNDCITAPYLRCSFPPP